MKKPKIYIAGKVTGLDPIDCALNFKAAADQLRAAGFLPINPLEVVNDFKMNWQSAMKLCIAELMKADATFLLSNWGKSRGAKIEVDICEAIEMPIFWNINDLKAFYEPKTQ